MEFVRKERKNFKPIDIIYKPTKNSEFSPLCYFTEDISKAYFYNVKTKLNAHTVVMNVSIAENFV